MNGEKSKVMVGGEVSSPLLSSDTHSRSDSVVYCKQPH